MISKTQLISLVNSYCPVENYMGPDKSREYGHGKRRGLHDYFSHLAPGFSLNHLNLCKLH